MSMATIIARRRLALKNHVAIYHVLLLSNLPSRKNQKMHRYKHIKVISTNSKL